MAARWPAGRKVNGGLGCAWRWAALALDTAEPVEVERVEEAADGTIGGLSIPRRQNQLRHLRLSAI
jgi:hypothetical protein